MLKPLVKVVAEHSRIIPPPPPHDLFITKGKKCTYLVRGSGFWQTPS